MLSSRWCLNSVDLLKYSVGDLDFVIDGVGLRDMAVIVCRVVWVIIWIFVGCSDSFKGEHLVNWSIALVCQFGDHLSNAVIKYCAGCDSTDINSPNYCSTVIF